MRFMWRSRAPQLRITGVDVKNGSDPGDVANDGDGKAGDNGGDSGDTGDLVMLWCNSDNEILVTVLIMLTTVVALALLLLL